MKKGRERKARAYNPWESCRVEFFSIRNVRWHTKHESDAPNQVLGFNKMQAPFSTCFYCSIIFVSFVGVLSFGADCLSSGQSMKDGETLVSPGQSFELGFFSPGSSKNRYLGIWYKITPETVVWVANGDNPLTDSSGVLTFVHEGNLALLNQSKGVVWSSNSSGVLTNPVARLLESGNLVLWDNISSNPSDAYSWQSFDYPCDTL